MANDVTHFFKKFFKKKATTSAYSDNLKFLEDVLAEEDPEFAETLKVIKQQSKQLGIKRSLLDQTKDFISDLKEQPKFLDFIKFIKKDLKTKIFNLKMIFFIIVSVSLFFGLYKISKLDFWFKDDQLFINSYADLGSLEIKDFDPKVSFDYFLENPIFSKNSVSLKKMIANIRASENSTDNPMIVLEMGIESLSAEVVIEIKDREAEFKDLVLRVIEEFDYDELESALGKEKLSIAVLTEVNKSLTTGKARKVLFKNFIIKP